MATQLLGGNRAYYTPTFFGSATGFDPSGGVGTAAIGEADALRSIISALLQGFTPGPGRQMSGGVDTGGSDFGTWPSGGEDVAKSGTSVNLIEAQQTLNKISKYGRGLGLISGLTGNPGLGQFLGTAGELAGAVAGAYNDPVRDALQTQYNKDLEMAGLEGNIDLGRYGYDPALVAASNIAPIITGLAGANPIVGGLAREGLMMAADPVPSTGPDLVKSGVDALVPEILNGVVKALTGNTIGEQMKGALTPVETAVPVEDRSTYPGEAPAGKTPEQALAEMLAEGVNVNMLDAGIPQVSDTIEPMSTQLEASGSAQSTSVESPVGAVSDTGFFSALDAISGIASDIAAATTEPAPVDPVPTNMYNTLSPVGRDVYNEARDIGQIPMDAFARASDFDARASNAGFTDDPIPPSIQEALNSFTLMGPSWEELMAGRDAYEAAQAAAPVDMSVPESSGASMEPSVLETIFNSMVDYQQQMESSYSPASEPAGDYGFSEAASDSYGYSADTETDRDD